MKNAIIILIVILLTSCSDDPMKFKKRQVIAKDKFVEILADIHLMDAITNGPGYFRTYDANDSIDLYSSIFEKYGVTKAKFDTTVANYSRNPEMLIEVYDEVILRLNLRLDTLRQNDPQFIRDEEELQ